jgi:hypothetical protein
MTDARRETPTNPNMLSPLIFKFTVKKLPKVTFFCQNINLPAVRMSNPEHPTPFVSIPQQGDHLIYDDLMINYKVDEDLGNYNEINNWLLEIGFPQNFEQHRTATNVTVASGEGLRSDLSLVVMNSARIPKFNIVFRDAFPVSISSLIFDTTLTEVNYLEAACTFKYTLFEIESIT